MFGRVLSFECRSYFRSKGFYVLAAVLLVLLVGVTLGCRFSEEDGAGEVYGVEAYSSREELIEHIEAGKERIAALEEWLRLSEGDLTVSPGVRKKMETELAQERQTLSVMSVLYEKHIAYEDCCAYLGAFGTAVQTKLPVSVLSLALCAGFGVIVLYFSAHIAVAASSEYREGQARLTMLLPHGRIVYALARLFSRLVTGVCLLAGYAVLSALFLACVSGTGGRLIAASAHSALALGFAETALLMTALYLFALAAFGVLAFSLAQLCRRPLPALLFTGLAAAAGRLVLPVELLLGEAAVSKFLPVCAFYLDGAFLSVTALPVWANVLLSAAFCGALLLAALLRLKYTDIR